MAILAHLAGCGTGPGASADAGPSPVDATVPDTVLVADASIDAPIDAMTDAALDAPTDAPPAPPSYTVVDTMVEVRADIGAQGTASVRIKNTGGTSMLFDFTLAGEDKNLSEQPLASGGCFADPGEECMGVVAFFPLRAGDLTTTLTIHPRTAGLSDTTLPVTARTYTRINIGDFSGPVAGYIVPSSPDVTCMGVDCSGRFVGDLTLTAMPAPGYVFVGWSEPSCGSSLTCLVPRSTLARRIAASFAPVVEGQLTVDMTGAPPGATVQVFDESFFLPQQTLAVCASSCVVPLPSEYSPTPQIRITVLSPRGVPAISGACTGVERCTFGATQSASISVRWTFDPKLPATWLFDIGRLRSVSVGPNGTLFVSTVSSDVDQTWTVKLDANGNVLWARPTTGQILALPDGGVVTTYPSTSPFDQQTMWFYKADGYRRLVQNNQYIFAPPPPADNDIYRFAKIIALGGGATLATPGVMNGSSAIEAWDLLSPSLVHWNATAVGTPARSIASNGAGTFYLASKPMMAEVSATKFSSAGVNLGNVAGVAQDAPLSMAVSPSGDIVTTSGTRGNAAEIALRRTSDTGQRRFERRLTLDSFGFNRAGVIVLPGDDVMWLRGHLGADGCCVSFHPRGFVAERVDPAGNVLWSLAVPSLTSGGGIEVFDLGGTGSRAYAVGGFENHGGTDSWIGVFAP